MSISMLLFFVVNVNNIVIVNVDVNDKVNVYINEMLKLMFMKF